MIGKHSNALELFMTIFGFLLSSHYARQKQCPRHDTLRLSGGGQNVDGVPDLYRRDTRQQLKCRSCAATSM